MSAISQPIVSGNTGNLGDLLQFPPILDNPVKKHPRFAGLMDSAVDRRLHEQALANSSPCMRATANHEGNCMLCPFNKGNGRC